MIKDRTRRTTQKVQEEKKRSSETEDNEKQRLANLKRMKSRYENELERKLRLEKVVARLAVEMEEERRASLEKMVALYPGPYMCAVCGVRWESGSVRARVKGPGNEAREDGSYQTAQVGHGDRRRKKRLYWRRW